MYSLMHSMPRQLGIRASEAAGPMRIRLELQRKSVRLAAPLGITRPEGTAGYDGARHGSEANLRFRKCESRVKGGQLGEHGITRAEVTWHLGRSSFLSLE